MPILLPVGSHWLTTLYIDTRKLREYSNTQALGFRSDTLKSFCKVCDLRGLRSLTVTNAGLKERRDRGHDVLSILRFCHLERLQYLELNFLTTYPRYLVDLLRACDWSVLRFVSIYRPQWNDKEMDNVPLWETLFDIEADGRIKIDYTEQLRIGKNYSEADIQFMVDNDIVPPVVAAYGEINRGFYKVLDDYVDREERKKNVLVPTQNPRHSDLALPLLPKPQSTTTRPYTPTPADEVQATTIIPLSPDLAKDTQLTPLRPQSPHRAELVTKSPEARILPAWKPSAPTYIPLKPHKFYSPLLSSCIVPNYKASSLLPPSTPSTSYKVKESTYSPALPDWQSELFPTGSNVMK
ncbi:MAG: hypothetical protein Q9202_007088 [Teloschistes flavicans]